MKTFLNIDFNKPIYWKFLLLHILYSLLWLAGIWIIIFRGDILLLKKLPENYDWIITTIPVIFIVIVLLIFKKSKWYYNISLIFYPILLVFWFLPKIILNKGKIYLLAGYLNFIFIRIKRYKSTLINTILTTFLILLLIVTNSNIVRVSSMIYFSFFYFKIVMKYINQSFQPIQLFGVNIEKSLDMIIEKPEKSYSIIKNYEINKADEKLPEKEKNFKRVERLIIISSLIEHLGTNLNSFKGKKAFVISWIYQLIGFVLLTFIYYSFINFELYIIDSSSFKTTIEPSIFDFIYYTIKTITFSNIATIVPQSILARIIEIITFLTVGVFVLIIVTSVIFSLKQDRIHSNIQKATEVCIEQNKFIAEHIRTRYKMNIKTILAESSSIRKSVENIKKIFEELL